MIRSELVQKLVDENPHLHLGLMSSSSRDLLLRRGPCCGTGDDAELAGRSILICGDSVSLSALLVDSHGQIGRDSCMLTPLICRGIFNITCGVFPSQPDQTEPDPPQPDQAEPDASHMANLHLSVRTSSTRSAETNLHLFFRAASIGDVVRMRRLLCDDFVHAQEHSCGRYWFLSGMLTRAPLPIVPVIG